MKGRLEELIHIFEDVANNPKRMVAEYKKEVGKEVIGVMPVYAPEEIIHAAGCLPIGLWGGKKEVSKARAYLPPFACSIMQTVMELQDRKSTRLNSSHANISYAVFCLKKKK